MIDICKNNYQYYYEQLTPQEQKAYQTLLAGYCKQDYTIQLHLSNTEQVQSVDRAVRYDHPELFYIIETTVRFRPDHNIVVLCPEYRFTESVCKNMLSEMDHRTSLLLLELRSLSEYERVKKIHDFLAQSIIYGDCEATYTHEVPGALLYGLAVCEGVAKTFKYIADRSGIQSQLVLGQGEGHGKHMWNMVYINGKRYHIDVTFDATLSKKAIRYDYFLLSDQQISRDHKWDAAPLCKTDFDYYEQAGLLMQRNSDLANLIRTELKPETPIFFRLPEMNVQSESLLSAVKDTLCSVLSKKYQNGYTLHLSYNLNRMIFYIELLE